MRTTTMIFTEGEGLHWKSAIAFVIRQTAGVMSFYDTPCRY